MSYCGKCGSKLGTSSHCENCGFPNQKKDSHGKCERDLDTRISPQPPMNYTKEQTLEVTKTQDVKVGISKEKFLNKKVIISGTLITILFLGYFVLSTYLSNPIKIVNSFKDAITKEDKSKLIKLIDTPSDVQLTEDSVIPVLSYYKNNPENLENLIEELTKEATVFKQGKLNKTIKSVGKEEYFLVKTSDNFGIKNYKIGYTPRYISLTSKMNNTSIALSGQDKGKVTKDSLKVGPLLPAIYELSAKHKEFFELEESKTIDLIDNSNLEYFVNLFEESYDIEIDSNKTGYKVFINNKEVKTINTNSDKIGPLSGEAEIYAILMDGDTELKTEISTVNKDKTHVSFEFKSEKELKSAFEKNLNDVISNYAAAFGNAVNNNNFELITSYLDPGSEIYKKQRAVIPAIHNKGIEEKFLKHSIRSFNFNKEKNTGEAIVDELYDIKYQSGTVKTESFVNKYLFKYEPETGEILLTDILD